jgi:RNA polymerase sigma-70 factor (ECF subfamily)
VDRPDERLQVEAAQRDPSRFAELYDTHFERVYAFVARRVRDRSEAEDVVAEVFYRALYNIRKFEWRGTPFVAWLYRIAWNELVDRGKRGARSVAITAEPTADEMDDVAMRATLYRLVDRLPEAQRTVIVRRFAEGRSIAEIATEMGRSEGSIKQLQHRALETLRRLYA